MDSFKSFGDKKTNLKRENYFSKIANGRIGIIQLLRSHK